MNTLQVISKDQSAQMEVQATRIKLVNEYHQAALKSTGDALAFNFLCGAELLALKEQTPHKQFEALKKEVFPHISRSSLGRYMQFAEGLVSKYPTLDICRDTPLLLANNEIPAPNRDKILSAVREVADAKAFLGLCRDSGLMPGAKQATPTPPRELSPDEKVDAELKQTDALAGDIESTVLLSLEGEGKLWHKVSPARRKSVRDALI